MAHQRRDRHQPAGGPDVRLVADERNEPRSNPRMLRVETLSTGPVGLGSRFRAAMRTRPRPIVKTTENSGYERPGSWRRPPACHHGHPRNPHLRPSSRRDPDAVVMGPVPTRAPQAGDPGSGPHRPAPRAEHLDEPQARSGRTGASSLLAGDRLTGAPRRSGSV
jgi:hypothetical protein